MATAERGLCGGFNSSIAKLAREHADRLIAQGKTVKIFTVGKKGNDALKRLYGKYIVEHIDFRGVKAMSFAEAQARGAQGAPHVPQRASSTSQRCSSPSSSR